MYDFFLHSPLFTAFLMIGIAFSAIYINHGIWYIKDRRIKSSEASMDAYDQFIAHDTAQPDDREAEWLNEHERICPKTLGGMSREDGVPTMHRICPECKDAQRRMWGIQAIRTPEAIMPDFVDPREDAKQAFANVITLHPEQAA
jgi:hypothetical protein